jgi:choline-phosphate cytidylyltransferase
MYVLKSNTSKRIVRDYEKYIARQFKRGTSRQELNVSWLKKNELDLKRHVAEMREAIRSNWTTTGQELGKELRQFWQASRPGSPARMTSYEDSSKGGSPRGDSPGPGSDFATGYSLGLIGGVRSWVGFHTRIQAFKTNMVQMTRSRQTNRDSQHGSDSSEEDSDERSPPRGRSGKAESSASKAEEEVDAQIEAMMDQNSKNSGA